MQARSVALEVGPTYNTTPGGHHQLPRVVSRRRKKIQRQRTEIAYAIRGNNPDLQGWDEELTQRVTRARQHIQQKQQQQNHHQPEDNQQQPTTEEQVLRQAYKQTTVELRAIDAEHTSKRKQEHIDKLRSLVDNKMKIGGNWCGANIREGIQQNSEQC
jgi:hypothetical protein